MTNQISSILSNREIKALLKIGDILVPENDPFPSFSQTGCIYHVDDAIKNFDPQDLSDLRLFFRIMSFLPKFMVRFILWWMSRSRIGLLRLGNLGIRGVVYTLYYSNRVGPDYKGKKIHDIIGYHVNTVPLES